MEFGRLLLGNNIALIDDSSCNAAAPQLQIKSTKDASRIVVVSYVCIARASTSQILVVLLTFGIETHFCFVLENHPTTEFVHEHKDIFPFSSPHLASFSGRALLVKSSDC